MPVSIHELPPVTQPPIENEPSANDLAGEVSATVDGNLERLRNAGEIGQFLIPFYTVALAEEPLLEETIIYPSSSKEVSRLSHAGGTTLPADTTESGRAEVHVNTIEGWGYYAKLLQERHTSAAISATKTGLSPQDLDDKTFAAIIFLHELGHVVDWAYNAPDQQARRTRRNKDMSALPVPNTSPGQLLSKLSNRRSARKFMRTNRQSLAALGISNVSQLAQSQEEAYRSLETEDIPDQFAAKVFQRVKAEAGAGAKETSIL